MTRVRDTSFQIPKEESCNLQFEAPMRNLGVFIFLVLSWNVSYSDFIG